MTSMARKSPNNIAPTQDFADVSPKPRIASGTLAADAPEFIPGGAYQPSYLNQHADDQKGDRKTSDVSSDRDEARAAEKKLKKRSRRYKKRHRVEEEVEEEIDEEVDEEALKQQAIDEEWWSGDDVFVPDLKDNEDLWSDELN